VTALYRQQGVKPEAQIVYGLAAFFSGEVMMGLDRFNNF